MLTEGKSIVRYIGKNPRPLNLHYQGALRDIMTFEPDPKHGGQRVEEFRNHESAQKFLHWQNRDNEVLFEIATDLITADDQAAVTKIVKEVMADELRSINRRLERAEKFMEKRGA